MKTVTLSQFKKLNRSWIKKNGGKQILKEIQKKKASWTALDVLNMEHLTSNEKLYILLREEFVPDEILHKFALACVDHAFEVLGIDEISEPLCFYAMEAKKMWLRHEISSDDLSFVVGSDSRYSDYSYRYAARYACLEDAKDAAFFASRDAADAVSYFIISDLQPKDDCFRISLVESKKHERQWQLETLKKMILEEKEIEENEKI